MKSYRYISNDADLDRMVSSLESAPRPEVAVDIEAELNLHVYGERFCLLQLYDGSHTAVVDPFGVSVRAIEGVLGNRSITKLVYDAAGDRALLYKLHGFLMVRLVDLKPAVEILGMEKQGLDSVLEEVLGVTPPASKKRWQQYNWTKRPIKPEAIDYAVRDVLYLFDLRDELFRRLEADGRMGEYWKENARREDIVPDTERRPGVFRSRRFQRLSKGGKSKFERLYEIRDEYARRLDLPPNSVLPNTDLFALSAGKIALADVRPNRRVPRGVFSEMKSKMAQ